MKNILILSAVTSVALFASSLKADIITQWTFEGSVLTPSTGLGTATLGTGGTQSFPSGVSPTGVGGSLNAWSSNTWDTGDYFQLSLSTTGFSGLNVGYYQTSSSTGPSTFKFAYSTDGTTFTDVGSPYTVVLNASPNTVWNATNISSSYAPYFVSFDLSSISALDNQPTVYFRIIDTAATGSASGTDRIDNFTVSTGAVPEPGTVGLVGLGLVTVLFGAKRRRA